MEVVRKIPTSPHGPTHPNSRQMLGSIGTAGRWSARRSRGGYFVGARGIVIASDYHSDYPPEGRTLRWV